MVSMSTSTFVSFSTLVTDDKFAMNKLSNKYKTTKMNENNYEFRQNGIDILLYKMMTYSNSNFGITHGYKSILGYIWLLMKMCAHLIWSYLITYFLSIISENYSINNFLINLRDVNRCQKTNFQITIKQYNLS